MQEDYNKLIFDFEDIIPERNIELFGNLPEPTETLYGIGNQCFKTINEFIEYCKKSTLSIEYIENCSYKISYFKKYANNNNVYIKTYNRIYDRKKRYSLMFIIKNSTEYAIYDYNRNIYVNNEMYNEIIGNINDIFKFTSEKKVYKLNRR